VHVSNAKTHRWLGRAVAVERAALDQRNHLSSESDTPFTLNDVLHRTM